MRTGEKVRWTWGAGRAEGTVREVHPNSVIRTIKGTEVTRHGTPEDPALLIEQEDGDRVLKLASEVERP